VNITYKVKQLGCEHHIQGQTVGLWTSHTRSHSWVVNITYKVKQLGCEHHIQGQTVGLWTSHTRSHSWVVNITYNVNQLDCEHHIQGHTVGLWTSHTRSTSWVVNIYKVTQLGLEETGLNWISVQLNLVTIWYWIQLNLIAIMLILSITKSSDNICNWSKFFCTYCTWVILLHIVYMSDTYFISVETWLVFTWNLHHRVGQKPRPLLSLTITSLKWCHDIHVSFWHSLAASRLDNLSTLFSSK